MSELQYCTDDYVHSVRNQEQRSSRDLQRGQAHWLHHVHDLHHLAGLRTHLLWHSAVNWEGGEFNIFTGFTSSSYQWIYQNEHFVHSKKWLENHHHSFCHTKTSRVREKLELQQLNSILPENLIKRSSSSCQLIFSQMTNPNDCFISSYTFGTVVFIVLICHHTALYYTSK